MKKIILLSDTHNKLDNRFFPHFEQADEIWHAGDIGDISIIEKLEEFAPIKAVWGNIDNQDIRLQFEKIAKFMCEKTYVIMTHIGGYPGKYSRNIIDIIQKEKPKIFISGHSHILKVMYDKKYNLLHMNPGAIGDYGVHNVKTLLSFTITGEKIDNLKVIEIPRKKY